MNQKDDAHDEIQPTRQAAQPGSGELDLNLDELIEVVSEELRRMGLESLPDRRASLLPDVRMVRYYTSLGLLKPPRLVQRQARYGRAHVEDMLLVKLLQVQGLSLARIQQELLGLGTGQKQAWLQQLRRQAVAVAEAPPAAVIWREVVLEPGLRLQLSSDYACKDPEAVLRRIKALLSQG